MVDADGVVVVLDRQLVLTEFVVRNASVVEDLVVHWIEADRLVVVLDCTSVLTKVIVRMAPVIVSKLILRIEAGRETVAPGEYGREALEIAIALRESHRRGGARVDLPLRDRSLELGGRP